MRMVAATAGAVLAGAAPAGASSAGATPLSGCAVHVVSSKVSPPTLHDGDGARQTITLNGRAPAGGLFIRLPGSNTGYRESTQLSVRVPAGGTSVTIPVRFTGASHTVVANDLSADSGCGAVATNDVTILALDPAVLAVSSVTVNRPTAVAGDPLTAVVALSAPARPTGTTVTLFTGDSYAPGLTGLPLTATVPAGKRTVTVAFRVDDDVSALTREHPGASTGSSAASGIVTVLPDHLAITAGIHSDQGRSREHLSLGPPAPAGGAVVSFTTDVIGLHLPATVTVPAGSRYVPYFVSLDKGEDGRGTVTATWQNQTATAQAFIY